MPSAPAKSVDEIDNDDITVKRYVLFCPSELGASEMAPEFYSSSANLSGN
jgi:hypothetical protein